MYEGIKSAAVNPNFGIRNRSNGRNLQDQHMLLIGVLDVCGSSVRLSEDNGFERTSTGSASWELLESTCNLIGTMSIEYFQSISFSTNAEAHLIGCIATKHNFKLLFKFGTIRNWKNIPNLPDESQCL
ncbi:unnamed protein product [Prunus armeniaca]